jgi:hypothetical protein
MGPFRAASPGFQEPARRLPLRWGGYETRLAGGLILIVTGAVHLQAANAEVNFPLFTGAVAQVIGWWILPAGGWRRVLATGPALIQSYAMLAGPQWMWSLVVPYLCWLLVRHRPLLAYVTVLPVVAYGVVAAAVFGPYSGMPLALAAGAAVLAVSAAGARAIAAIKRKSQVTPVESDTE